MARMKSSLFLKGIVFGLILFLACGTSALAQSTAALQGTVLDAQGAVVAGAKVTVKNLATDLTREVETDSTGNFKIPALPAGNYRVEIRKEGFRAAIANSYTLEVGTTATQNFTLAIGNISETIEVSSDAPVIESSTMTVGQVINQKTVQEIPLNGRHFVDLGLLIPGSVTPPQSGFLTAPLRGQGSFAINTAGNREDTVNFMINGINLNDQVQNQITFQPSINTVSEFKVDNSTYSAESGRSSGAIVNIATRSGTNSFHGEAFEYLRNDAMDARNFFNSVTSTTGAPLAKNPFKRNQFGGALGGRIWKDKTFFFFSYEGTRQRQRVDVSKGVLGDSKFPRPNPTIGQPPIDERALAQSTGNPTVVKLLPLIPNPNSTDAKGNPIFVGGAIAPVNIDQWTGDVSHSFNQNDRLHGYYAFQRDLRQEPTLQGNTIPGFGDTRQSRRQILTLNETHIFNPVLVNEARLGFNRIHITFTPNAQLNPRDFGINDGITTAIGLPQIAIGGILLNLGGPSGFPQGRGDTTAVLSDSLSWQRGRHGLKFGGEVRRFYNDNFNLDTGSFTFASPATFINGSATAFTINLSNGASRILQPAWGLFAMDSFKWKPNFTLELGLRYDWNGTPAEAQNRFILFDPATSSLLQQRNGIDQVYGTNNKNVEPRVGFVWDPFKTGKTSIRGGYAIQVDQPVTNAVTGLSTNPPFGKPISVTSGTITFANPGFNPNAPLASTSPATINQAFKNAYVQSWNLNIQREITPSLGLTVGYFGSKGTHLRIARNLNQPIAGARPFPRLLTSAAFACPQAGATQCPTLGNMTIVDSIGNSSYNALWVTANKRLAHGLQFNASYTYSHSIDYNSLSSQGVVVQDSNNVRNDRGSSDYDARNRFVINWLYALPFKGNRLKEGWQLSAITQWQSGNPINILVGTPANCPAPLSPDCGGSGAGSRTGPNSTGLTGLATLRPDLGGSFQVTGDPSGYFTNTVCNPSSPVSTCSTANPAFILPLVGGVYHFGNLGRNVFTGPKFSNTDFSVTKTTKIAETLSVQFRAEMFDVFNRPNFGQPGRVAIPGSAGFGQISNTRFPAGDSGSARQVQFALKLLF